MNRTATFPLLYDAVQAEFVELNVQRRHAHALDGHQELFRDWAFRITRDQAGHWLEALEGETRLDQQSLSQVTRLRHRGIIQTKGRRAFVFVEHEDAETADSGAMSRWLVSTLRRRLEELRTTAADELVEDTLFPHLPASIRLQPSGTILGRDEQASTICLRHPQVSRKHASVEFVDGRARLVDLNSFNGTFVNGTRIYSACDLAIGDRIDIGPFSFIYTGDSLFPQTVGEDIDLVASKLSFRVADGAGSKLILDELSLVVRAQEFVCLLGPSGAGKTVLLKMLSGQIPPTSGQVYVNGESLYASFASLKRLIAVVPQRDVLHDRLSLGSAMRFTARLRLPEDMTRRDRATCVQSTVENVGLNQQLASQICRLSGGQTRRASLANEILARPGLLFLDEVTSGLDEETDGEMMRLFRQLAEEGKTVVCVTHNLNHVEKYCHLIAVLTDGKLAFFGSPAEARAYFKVASLGALYRCLHERPAAEWQREFRDSELYARHVTQRTPSVLLPSYLRAPEKQRSWTQPVRTFLRQWLILTQRNLAIKWSNPRWFLLMAVQCAGLAILLAWLFGDVSKVQLSNDEKAQFMELAKDLAKKTGMGTVNLASPMLAPARAEGESLWVEQKRATLSIRLLLALTMCALWLGCNNASGEIVRERAVFEKERDVNLSVAAYLSAHVVVLSLAMLVQVVILLVSVRWLSQLPGSFWPQLLLLFVTGAVGVMLGLAISAWVRTTAMGTIIVPIVLIPQIMLAGAFVPLDGARLLCAEWFVSMHWGYRGLIGQLQFDPAVERLLKLVGALPEYVGLHRDLVYAVLLAHAAIFLVIAYVGLRLRIERNPIAALQNAVRRAVGR